MSAQYVTILNRLYPSRYSIDDVRKFLKAGKITAEEFKQITNEEP